MSAGIPDISPRWTAGDALLGLSLLVLTLVPLGVTAEPGGKGGAVLEVLAGEERRAVPLGRDSDHILRGPLGPARLVIRKGEATLENPPCPENVCEKMGPVSRPGEVILCIPNRISIRVAGGTPVDAVTR